MALDASELLCQYRRNLANPPSVTETTGYFAEFAADRYGSRKVQKDLDASTPIEKAIIFNELKQHLLPLVKNQFGNYVIQKMFDLGTSQQRNEMIVLLVPSIHHLSKHMYGCWIVQKGTKYVCVIYT